MGNSKLSRVADEPKKGMTLAELKRFVEYAEILELPGDTPVKATVGFGAQLKTLETR